MTTLIANGALKPGDRIPSEKQLCEQLGVGRTSVREALRSLSVIGILESRAGSGTFVVTNSARHVERTFQWGVLLDPRLVDNLIETRLMLESQTAFLAASRATATDLKALERSIEGMEASLTDWKSFLQHDLRFHLRIAHAARNSILESLLTTIRGHLHSWLHETLALSTVDRPTLSNDQHRRILRTLESHDAEAARSAMEAHIISSSDDLRTRLASKASGRAKPA
jgi:GntR family transcriptional regulator, transcriptional repressor for pyruvate dehydrogenase complex